MFSQPDRAAGRVVGCALDAEPPCPETDMHKSTRNRSANTLQFGTGCDGAVIAGGSVSLEFI